MRTDKPSTLSRLSTGLIAVIGLIVLYVLSLGPAVGLGSRDYVSEKAVETAYYPLAWLSDRNDTVDKAIRWYVKIWLAPDPDPFPIEFSS